MFPEPVVTGAVEKATALDGPLQKHWCWKEVGQVDPPPTFCLPPISAPQPVLPWTTQSWAGKDGQLEGGSGHSKGGITGLLNVLT